MSYLLETADGLVWRRHVDHLKKRVSSPLSSSLTQSGDVSTSWDVLPDSGDHTAGEEQSDPELVTTGQDSIVEAPSSNVEANPESTSSTTAAPQPEQRRYPTRERQVPNYFRPGT